MTDPKGYGLSHQLLPLTEFDAGTYSPFLIKCYYKEPGLSGAKANTAVLMSHSSVIPQILTVSVPVRFSTNYHTGEDKTWLAFPSLVSPRCFPNVCVSQSGGGKVVWCKLERGLNWCPQMLPPTSRIFGLWFQSLRLSHAFTEDWIKNPVHVPQNLSQQFTLRKIRAGSENIFCNKSGLRYDKLGLVSSLYWFMVSGGYVLYPLPNSGAVFTMPPNKVVSVLVK